MGSKTQENQTGIKPRATLPQVKNALERWQEGLKKLEEEVKTIRMEAQASYREQIADLRSDWKQVYARVRALEEGTGEEWANAQAQLQERVAAFRQAFLKTAHRLQEEEKMPLGWLQGFTDERKAVSEGWTQGMGARPQGSKGWTEGQGKRPAGSEGWVEGYEKSG